MCRVNRVGRCVLAGASKVTARGIGVMGLRVGEGGKESCGGGARVADLIGVVKVFIRQLVV